MKNTFTTGLMAAGKSKVLIEDFNKSIENSNKVYSLAFSIDHQTRYIGKIESRNGTSIPCTLLNKNDHYENRRLILDLIRRRYKEIYIDEIQFSDSGFVKELLDISKNYNVNFYFYGLLTTFTGEYFPSSKVLMESLLEENISIISMECQMLNCDSIATNNARIVDGKIIREGKTYVEQKSKYMSLCKNHYFS